ncbi:hypothetical protein DLAC_05261 [Tieghemostelium lacteum]|uniref:Uncharacterized protein n=1 Tax=Tieghemostelium lacteum TaxID=361077 RepID=A0A151ZIN7_TIELA|nr:hypothetical protein DLAC_05261 [Tieghemostelium lacteum]|eukprot:KYQ93861.1 hypothetical protein DLAC_05261 [Tieghemostelium lacteum]
MVKSILLIILVITILYLTCCDACYSAYCQQSYGNCKSCMCSSGHSLACGWTGGGCVCASGSATKAFEEKGQLEYIEKGEDQSDENVNFNIELNEIVNNQPPPNFICSIDGTSGKGSFVFQGFIGYDQTVTCTKYASSTITSYSWAVHNGCKNGGSLVVTANMINFSCKCTKFNGCSSVSNILYYTY